MYKTVLITGVSSGLGHGLANFYLQQGSSVYALNRKQPADLLEHNNFHFVSCDLSDETQVQTKVKELLSDVVQLDLVVLNAGILNELKDMRDTPLSEVREVMEINTWANKSIIDALVNNVDSITQIVAISSGAAVSGNRGWNAYSLSKAALNMLIKLYADELPDIHFSALAPGLVDTAMQDYICDLKDDRFYVVERLKSCRGTDSMPGPQEAAVKLDIGFKKVVELPSGEFNDVRKL
ncbi:MAG: SDR family NAD(P)-dependent oxidoreductase [Gammaproteobacteria bacterium]|nr:SDR family NAD(P)-dependent oxidoreductase [Gammaproteobacteria bacterium]